MSETPERETEKAPGLKVLVVDDDADCTRTLGTLIRLLGHQVEVASNGPEALEKARTNPPDVVFLDLGMPRMSGYEVARRLREMAQEKDPLLVAVTGFGREEDRKRSEEAGFHLHLIKPADPDELDTILKRFQKIIAG